MRYNSRNGQTGNSSYNVVKAKNPLGKYKDYQDKDDYDTRSSATTASTASDSDHDGHKQGRWIVAPPPPPPPAAAARTPLKSLKTKLTSKAALFVPGGAGGEVAMPAPAGPIMMPGGPTPGKETLRGVIESTLGSELWDLAMVDCQGFTGEWYTGVAITIPALSASMCHLATSQDAEAIANAQQATQSKATQSLLRALQSMSPNMVINPSDDASRLSVEFCGADRDKLCWEFSHFGQCPRYATCRWAHAMVETFMISIILQPLMDGMQWGMQCVQPPVSQATPSPAAGRWQPQRAPAPPKESRTVAALPLTRIQHKGGYSSEDDDDNSNLWSQDLSRGALKQTPSRSEMKASTPSTSSGSSSPTNTPSAAPRKPRVGRAWADIQEDSDSDDVTLSFQ